MAGATVPVPAGRQPFTITGFGVAPAALPFPFSARSGYPTGDERRCKQAEDCQLLAGHLNYPSP
jgi:hypothetical protein